MWEGKNSLADVIRAEVRANQKRWLTMHFFAFEDISPYQNYAQCYWRVKDVDALYEECHAVGLSRSGTPRLVPVEDKPWGMREFSITDPNGNLVRVGKQMSEA